MAGEGRLRALDELKDAKAKKICFKCQILSLHERESVVHYLVFILELQHYTEASGCGSVGTAVASDTSSSRFESSHWKILYRT